MRDVVNPDMFVDIMMYCSLEDGGELHKLCISEMIAIMQFNVGAPM